MRRVTSYEAKSKLPEFIRAVESGERIVITRRGVPVAELSPLRAAGADLTDLFARIDASRRGRRLDGLSLLALRDEGRR